MNEKLIRELYATLDVTKERLVSVDKEINEEVNKIDKEFIEKLYTETSSGMKAKDVLSEVKEKEATLVKELAEISNESLNKQDIKRKTEINEELVKLYEVLNAYKDSFEAKEAMKKEVELTKKNELLANEMSIAINLSKKRISSEIEEIKEEIIKNTTMLSEAASEADTKKVEELLDNTKMLNKSICDLNKLLNGFDRLLNSNNTIFGDDVRKEILGDLTSEYKDIIEAYYDLSLIHEVNMTAKTNEVEVASKDEELENIDTELENIDAELENVDTELENVDTELENVDTELENIEMPIIDTELIATPEVKTPVVDTEKEDSSYDKIKEFSKALFELEETALLRNEIEASDLSDLVSKYANLDSDTKDSYKDRINNLIKINNNNSQKLEQNIRFSKEPKLFGKFALVSEAISGKIVDSIGKSKLFKKFCDKKIEKAYDKLDNNKAKKYANLLNNQVEACGLKLLVNKNKLEKLNYKLYKEGLTDKETKKLQEVKETVSEEIYNGVVKNVDEDTFNSMDKTISVLDQLLEVVALSDDYENNATALIDTLDSINKKGILTSAELKAYENELNCIVAYRKTNENDIYYVNTDEINNSIHYYDSEEYKKTGLPYVKRR